MRATEPQPLENVIMSNNQMLLDIKDIAHKLCLDYFEFFIYDTKYSFTFFKDIENLCRTELEQNNNSFNTRQFFTISESYYTYLQKAQQFCKISLKHAEKIDPQIYRKHKIFVLFANRKTPSYLLIIQTLKQLRSVFGDRNKLEQTTFLNNIIKNISDFETELKMKQNRFEAIKNKQLQLFYEQLKHLERIFEDLINILSAADLIFDHELHKIMKTFPLNSLLSKSIKTGTKLKS